MLKGDCCLLRTGVAVLVEILPLVPWLMEEVHSSEMFPSKSTSLPSMWISQMKA